MRHAKSNAIFCMYVAAVARRIGCIERLERLLNLRTPRFSCCAACWTSCEAEKTCSIRFIVLGFVKSLEGDSRMQHAASCGNM